MFLRYLSILFLCCSSFFVDCQTVGVLQNDPEALNGYTLVTPNRSRLVYLIDNCGNTVKVWNTGHIPGLATYLLEDGTLLRTCRVSNSFSAGGVGGKLQMQNWDGDVTWSYEYSDPEHNQHHDVEMLPNGNILMLTWEKKYGIDAIEAGIDHDTVIWNEKIVELEINGDSTAIVWEWNVWDHLVQNFDSTKANYGVIDEHPELMNANFGYIPITGDWLHYNSIDYNEELDQILVSSRHTSEIYIIDHSTTTEEAAGHTGGNAGMGGDLLYRWGNPAAYYRGFSTDKKLFGPHAAEWIPEGQPNEGKIIVFNNGFGRPGGLYTTIDIIDPPMLENGQYEIDDVLPFAPELPYWSYADEDTLSFYSSYISNAQPLENGNILICNGARGEFFEITPDKEKVWQYVNPVSSGFPIAQGDTATFNDCFRAYRFPVDYTAFDGIELIASAPIELNPESDCIIHDSTVVIDAVIDFEELGVGVVANPFLDELNIYNNIGKLIHIEIYDLNGRLVSRRASMDNTLKINTTTWARSPYIIQFKNVDQTLIAVQKILKQ